MDDLKLGDVLATGVTVTKEKENSVQLFEVVVDVEKATKVLQIAKGEGVPGGLPGTKMMTGAQLRDYLETLKQ